MDNAHALFEIKLQAVLSAERRILDMLDDAASDAKAAALREAFQHHRAETQGQIERIEQVFSTLGKTPRNVDAPVVEGLFEEKRRFLSEDPVPEVLDIFHMAAGVKTEHIEIAAYEELLMLAEQMGAADVAEPLRQNLKEEQATLEKLTRMAKEGTVALPRKGAAAKTGGDAGASGGPSKGETKPETTTLRQP